MTTITDRLPRALPLLDQMVNMESPSFDKALVDRFARFVGDNFEEIGGEWIRSGCQVWRSSSYSI